MNLGNGGFTITSSFPNFGMYVSSAGDFNLDGKFDIVIRSFARDSGTPFATVINGTGNDDLAGMNVNADNIGTSEGVNFVGALDDKTSNFKSCVTGGMDINGDGADEIAVGLPFFNSGDQGLVFVIFGSKNGYPNAVMDVSDLGSAVFKGFRIAGAKNDYVGYSMSLGDTNHDGYADIALGSSIGTSIIGGNSHGYIIFGGEYLNDLYIDLSIGNSNGVTYQGIPNTGFGFSVSSGRDINGDGIIDSIFWFPFS